MGESKMVWKSSNIPDWFVRLHKAGCKQVWLVGVAASQVGIFSPSVIVVELFFNFMDKEASQPDQSGFVPFIFLSGTCRVITMSCKCVKKSLQTSYPHPKLQVVTTFMTQEPSAIPAPITLQATATNPPAKN
jgi:hypothetical protein